MDLDFEAQDSSRVVDLSDLTQHGVAVADGLTTSDRLGMT